MNNWSFKCYGEATPVYHEQQRVIFIYVLFSIFCKYLKSPMAYYIRGCRSRVYILFSQKKIKHFKWHLFCGPCSAKFSSAEWALYSRSMKCFSALAAHKRKYWTVSQVNQSNEINLHPLPTFFLCHLTSTKVCKSNMWNYSKGRTKRGEPDCQLRIKRQLKVPWFQLVHGLC